jgi:hypothetical protein
MSALGGVEFTSSISLSLGMGFTGGQNLLHVSGSSGSDGVLSLGMGLLKGGHLLGVSGSPGLHGSAASSSEGSGLSGSLGFVNLGLSLETSNLLLPFGIGLHLDLVPFLGHESLSVLHELTELLGLDTVIHGAETVLVSSSSRATSGNGLVRIVRVSLTLGTSMGSSSGEADESLFAVVGGIAISLAHTEEFLGAPALGDESGFSLSGGSGYGGNSGDDSNEGSHVFVINNYNFEPVF